MSSRSGSEIGYPEFGIETLAVSSTSIFSFAGALTAPSFWRADNSSFLSALLLRFGDLSDVSVTRLLGQFTGAWSRLKSSHNEYPLIRILTAVIVCLAMTTAALAFDQVRATTALAHIGASAATTLADAPAALRSAVETDLGTSALQQFGATYAPHGAKLTGAGFTLHLGRATMGRNSTKIPIANVLTQRTLGATYGSGDFTETFKPVEAGIEQTFTVARRPSGTGPLVIDVPVEGLTAASDGSVINLHGHTGKIQATYSRLRVTDAAGKSLPTSLQTADNGRAIAIRISDANAKYPLNVDPTWSQISEFSASEGSGLSGFGNQIVISGSTALIPAVWQNNVYVFSESGGNWIQRAIISPTAEDEDVGEFGAFVALDGDTAVIGAPDTTVSGNVNQGAAYVFTGSGASWSQSAVLTSSDGSSGDAFGGSVAISASTIVVGAPFKTLDGTEFDGAAYIFTFGGSDWTQTYEYENTATPQETVGISVAISGTTVVIGAQGVEEGSVTSGGAFVLTKSEGTWSESSEITPGDGTNAEQFGYNVWISGSTIVVGAPSQTIDGNTEQGAVYVYGGSGSSWSETNEITSANGDSYSQFGTSLAVSGSTMLVTANAQTVDGNFAQGAVYSYALIGSTWNQTGEFSASNATAYTQFGDGIAMSESSILVGSSQAELNGTEGAVYEFSSTGLVQPQGTTPTTDTYSGGSPSEPCQCADVPATSSVGDPVNTATGDLYQSSTDLTLPGAGVTLSFTRTYDAQDAQAEEAASASVPPLGYGWSDNFGMNVSYDLTTQVATVTEENGAQVTFSPYVSGTSPAWCSGLTDFCASAPRIEATLNQNGDDSWTYVRDTGSPTTFDFSSTGALTSITDQQGDTVTSSTYSPGGGQTACPASNTCEAWTSSASGRELVLATNSSGQLTEVFDANSSLAANFAYSGTGCSTWSSGPVDLCSATDPGGLVESFTYDSANTTASFDYDLLTDTPPGASSSTTNVYNDEGQVTQQTNPAGDVTTFAYTGTNSTVLGGTTTVTNYPLGTGTGEPEDITVDTYSSNVLVGVATGYGTPSASNEIVTRDPASLLPLAVENGDGNSTSMTYQTYSGSGGTETSSGNVLTSTDAVGNTTAYAYNSFNQAWCTVDAADYANGTSCPSTAPTSPPSPGSADPNLGLTINYYNSADQLTATTDALGNTTTYAYTSGVSGVPSGLLYCSVDPVSYQNDVTCPAYDATHVTGTTTSTFDAAGDTLTSTNANGDTTTYVYDAVNYPGLVSSETDPDGTVTAYTYNAAGQVTSQGVTFQSYSATTLTAYDTYGREYCSVAPAEAALGVTCPTSAPTTPPTPSSDSYLGATITSYNANGQVVQVTNPLGGVTYTGYDEAGEAFCSVAPGEAALGVTCPSSDPSDPPTVGSDSYLGATITTYNANGQVVQVTNPLGGITLTTYDGAGDVLSTTVESNNATSAPDVVTDYTYDANSRVVSTTVDSGSPLAETTLQSYDPNGNVYCNVSANADASGTYQCPPWQTTWITAPPSPTALYSATPTSAQANNVTTNFYDANGDLLQSTNPDVKSSITAVDGDGRTYCTSDAVNVDAWLSANPSGTYPYNCPATAPSTPPATGSDPDYVTTILDAVGNTLSTTNQLGSTTSYTYDAVGNVLTTTNARGEVTTNCYYHENGSGACAHSAPAAGGTGDDLYSTTTPDTSADPSGEMTTYAYYPGEANDTTTTPAGTATKVYDAMGDLLSTTYSGVASGYATPTTTSDTYNVDGTVHTMTDASGTTTYGYDAMGNVTNQALVAAGGSGLANATTSYTYFSTGAVATLTYPNYDGSSDPVVTYAYDGTGAMISSTDWLGNVVSFAHDADGNETAQDNDVSTANPSGTSSTALAYDNADQITAATSTLNQTCGSSETLTQSFSGSSGSRDDDGDLTEMSDSYSATCSGQTSSEFNYSYDDASDVVYEGTTAQGSSPNNFAYDDSGDPTTISSHDSSDNFDSYTQTFDAAGEDTGQSPISGSHGSSSTYTYDTIGDQIKDVSTTTTTYGFNAAGQMVSATTPSGETTYLYNGDGLESGATPPASSGSVLWNAPVDVDSTRAIDAETCTSATFCVAVGASGYAAIYTGSWATANDVDSTRTMDAVSCTSSTFCVAVDTSGYATIYNGTSWSTPSDIDSTRSVDAVKCTSTTFCVAVGASGYASIYAGAWATATDVDSTRTMDAVSCTSSTFCVTGDTTGYSAKYTGTWATATDIDSTRSISTVTCTSSTFCVTGDTTGYSAKYTGTWATATDIDSTRSIKQVTCETSSFCVAIGSAGYAAIYTGSWASATDVDSSNALEALSCASTTYCVGSDGDGNVLTFNGTSWSSATDVDATRSVTSLSCPTSTFCVTGDGSGYAALYALTTQSWNAATDVAAARAIDAETCASSSFCVAVGASGYASIYNGTSWSTPSDIDSTRTMDAVSCVSSSFCVAVDTSGYATIYNGTSWSTPSDIDSTRSVDAVKCTSTTFCVAVGASGYAEIYTGTWATASDVDSTRTMDAVSCTSSTFCVAVDTSGYAAKYTGTWATATDIDSTRSIDTVSCESSTFCVAAGASGYAAKYTGTWATATDIDSTRTIKAVLCPSSTLCVAVDSSGYSTTYNGTSWATATDIDGSNALEALSCASATYCAVSDADGNVLTFNGTSWSSATDVDATRSVTSISCPTSTFCVTGDGSGYAALYAPVPATTSTSQLTWNTTGSLSLILSDSAYDYIYGPNAVPVEEINLATSAPTFMTYTPADSSWFTTNAAGDETGFYGYDAYGTLAFGSATTSFGYAGQYTDATTGFSNLRARWYEDGTGSFTSRDPDFSRTDSAYTYADGNPVNLSDPTGLDTVGVCGNISAAFAFIGGFGGSGTLCLVRTVFTPQGNDDIGFTETAGWVGAGLGIAAGGSIEYQVSNANHLKDLGHSFWNANITIPLSAGVGLGVNASVFWGDDQSNQSIFGAEVGPSFGIGGGGFLIRTNTWVQKVNGTIPANILRGIWDALVPAPLMVAANLRTILGSAKSQVGSGSSVPSVSSVSSVSSSEC